MHCGHTPHLLHTHTRSTFTPHAPPAADGCVSFDLAALSACAQLPALRFIGSFYPLSGGKLPRTNYYSPTYLHVVSVRRTSWISTTPTPPPTSLPYRTRITRAGSGMNWFVLPLSVDVYAVCSALRVRFTPHTGGYWLRTHASFALPFFAHEQLSDG